MPPHPFRVFSILFGDPAGPQIYSDQDIPPLQLVEYHNYLHLEVMVEGGVITGVRLSRNGQVELYARKRLECVRLEDGSLLTVGQPWAVFPARSAPLQDLKTLIACHLAPSLAPAAAPALLH